MTHALSQTWNQSTGEPHPDFARAFACPVQLTLKVVGGKWKPLILWELRIGGRRFNALQAALPDVTHKVLTSQLRDLVRAGVVQRFTGKGQTLHTEYRLTAFGQTLRPVMNAMAGWAKDHHKALGATIMTPTDRSTPAGQSASVKPLGSSPPPR